MTFEKDSNHETITIPVHRIDDVLDMEESAAPTVLLNGRLQWLTLPQRWRFFPDKPSAEDLAGIGFGKDHAQNDATLGSLFASRGYHCGWSSAANLPGRLQGGYEVFYDEDGNYLRSGSSVFVLKRSQ